MKNIQIKGVVTTTGTTADGFMSDFIKWLESKNYEFNGGASEIPIVEFDPKAFEPDPENCYDIRDIEGE